MEWIGIIVLVSSFIILLSLGVPIAYSIGISGTLTMLVSIPFLPAVATMAQRMATGLESFTLLAIPFFIFAGQIMNRGGIARRLIDFAKVMVGRIPGGLSFVNVIANMLFGAISGSAAASASAIGTIVHPRMKEEGYDENFSTAINVSSATTGLIIPPSNILIVYALASGGVSISALFVAGYIPGILMGLFLMGVGAVYAYRKKYPVDERVPFRRAVRVTLAALPSLFLLVVVVGGMIAGYFTATEASSIAVVYCLILSFIYREITWKDMPQIILKTISTTAIVMLLIATSIGLSWIMSYENIPETVSRGLLSVSNNKFVVLLIINIILLMVGIFMDMTPAVLIFTPIFLPIVTSPEFGMNEVHFGIVLVMNLCVGLITPPVGSVLFVGCSVSGVKIQHVIKPLLPMFAVMIICLLLVTYFEDLSLWLPRVFDLLEN